MIDFSPMNVRMWSRLGSCGAFGFACNDLPMLDDKCVVLTSDLCFYSGLERFFANYPDRFYNVGIAEQNMIGVAGGLFNEGFNPIATTYGTFASMRVADQVRVSMGYMKLGIKLVGLTSGLSVGILGATHISIEDIAVMRAIPNVTILSPADCTETVKATLALVKMDGPVYLRLTGPMNNPTVYKEDYDFVIGKAITVREGTDVAIIATGTMVHNSIQAAKMLEESGIFAKVIDMHTIKPLDEDAIRAEFDKKLIVTVEEHSVFGGLGSAVAEVLAQSQDAPKQKIIGINDRYCHAGTYPKLVEEYGLTAESIKEQIQNEIER